jgi:hypothetical protein
MVIRHLNPGTAPRSSHAVPHRRRRRAHYLDPPDPHEVTAHTAYFTCDTNPTVEQPFCVPLLAQILKM